jgi:hypothetical protein
MKFSPQICACGFAAALMASGANAAVTRYDITATASGTLNGVAFTGQSLDLVILGGSRYPDSTQSVPGIHIRVDQSSGFR